jgi:hypothetical protein
MDQTDTPLCLHHGLEKLKQEKVSELTVTSHISLVSMSLGSKVSFELEFFKPSE